MTHFRDTMASIKYPYLSWEVQFTTFCMSANMDCVHSITVVVTSCLFSPKGNVTLTQAFPLIICKEQTRCLFEHRSLFAHVSVLNLRFELHHPRNQRRGNHDGVGWDGLGWRTNSIEEHNNWIRARAKKINVRFNSIKPHTYWISGRIR